MRAAAHKLWRNCAWSCHPLMWDSVLPQSLLSYFKVQNCGVVHQIA